MQESPINEMNGSGPYRKPELTGINKVESSAKVEEEPIRIHNYQQELDAIIADYFNAPTTQWLLYQYYGMRHPLEIGRSVGMMTKGEAWHTIFTEIFTKGDGRFNPNLINLTLWLALERKRKELTGQEPKLPEITIEKRGA